MSSEDSSEDDEQPVEDEQAFLNRLDERNRQYCDQETAPAKDAAWAADTVAGWRPRLR